jgi:hypothetical protein
MEISLTGSSDPEFRSEWFSEQLRHLENLLGIANALSNAAVGSECSFLAYQASLVFSKLALGVLGLLRFLPGSIYYADKIAQAVDLSSASVLARQVLSDTITFLYLADRDISQDDREFRGAVWSLQAIKQSYDFIKLNDPADPLIAQIEPDLLKCLECFEKHKLYGEVQKGIKALIKGGKRALWKTDYDILNGYGLRKKCYDAPFLIFSNFVHASELSLNLMLQTGAQRHDNHQRFFYALTNTIAFFAVDIEVFIECFPACKSRITEDGLALLKDCSTSVRKPEGSK